MHIVKNSVQALGSCNFCDKGVLVGHANLAYPYNETIAVTGCSTSVRICPDCSEELAKELAKKIELKLTNLTHEDVLIQLPKDKALSLLGILALAETDYKRLDSSSILELLEDIKTQIKKELA